MKKIRLFVLALFFLFQSPVFAGDFKSYLANPDPFSPDVVHYFSSPLDINEISFWHNTGFSHFEIHHLQSPSGVIWFISTIYNSSDWLFVEKLKFLVDGKVFEFQSSPNPKRETGVMGDAYVQETNQFTLSNDLIAAVKNAKSITIRLAGNHYYQDRVMPQADITNVQWFISQMEDIESGNKEKSNTHVSATNKTKPLFGVNFSDLPPAAALAINHENLKAVLVVSVNRNSVCEKSGIKAGDVIYEFDGKTIGKSEDLQKAVAETELGKEVTVKYFRMGSEAETKAQF